MKPLVAAIVKRRERRVTLWMEHAMQNFKGTSEQVNLSHSLDVHMQRLDAAFRLCDATCELCNLPCMAKGTKLRNPALCPAKFLSFSVKSVLGSVLCGWMDAKSIKVGCVAEYTHGDVVMT